MRTHPFELCLFSHPYSFGSFTSSIPFLRKHDIHPSNKLPVMFEQALRMNKHRHLDLWSDGHSLF